ncbi:MAG: hypothetical protein KKE00_09860 [Proteobacteria bacterium]|nr:hypothetical protein [Pseudomonadota bacterium]
MLPPDNGCDASSWYKDCEDKKKAAACDKCNTDVKKCMAKCKTNSQDDPNKENYYCKKLHKYVKIPGDFPDYKTAKKACEG